MLVRATMRGSYAAAVLWLSACTPLGTPPSERVSSDASPMPSTEVDAAVHDAADGESRAADANVVADARTEGCAELGCETSTDASADDASAPEASTSDASASDAGAGDAAASTTNQDAGALPGWKLVWFDEFDGVAGAQPDATKWTFEIDGDGEGDGELQYYSDSVANAALDGNGHLLMTAKLQTMGSAAYTSSRINTLGKFEHMYGRYEARIRMAKGAGLWSIFWMMGTNANTVGWPQCGEMDIMSSIGKEPMLVHGSLQGPSNTDTNVLDGQYASVAPIADDFHVFAMEWETDAVRWYVDDVLYETRTHKDFVSGAAWVFDHPFYLILNVAVGGGWAGSTDGTTFPQTMTVDYVRVYDAAP